MKVRLLLTLAPVLAIAVAPSVTLAQDNGSHKRNDPTGGVAHKKLRGQFILTVFHKGGTLTGDLHGEALSFRYRSANFPPLLLPVFSAESPQLWFL